MAMICSIHHDDQDPESSPEGNLATDLTVLNTFLEFGMKRLVGGRRIFINFTNFFHRHPAPDVVTEVQAPRLPLSTLCL